MPKKDINQLAFGILQQAIGEQPKPAPPTPKQENSRKGGLKGGKTRMDSMSAAERSELGKQAAKARWEK